MTTRILSAGLLLVLLAGLTLRGAVDDPTYQGVVARQPAVGDLVFTRVGGPVFNDIAETTHSWTSHVGIIVDYQNGD